MLSRAQQVRTATEYSYRRGEASFVEFLDAVRAFNDTMRSYNEARAGYARSLYTIDSISGTVQSAIGSLTGNQTDQVMSNQHASSVFHTDPYPRPRAMPVKIRQN